MPAPEKGNVAPYAPSSAFFLSAFTIPLGFQLLGSFAPLPIIPITYTIEGISDKKIIKLYAASPGLQCISLYEFITRISWPRDQAQASGGGGMFGAEAMIEDDLEEDSDAFEGI
ncbi:hypothetical protein LR48_Vigan10g178900 [Vigna angularis]|uniref:Uncharacterized protein n=1 Tax=Phaseolus angularis TaxID=3914 RepID=A0A0L9VLW8_PHAAN|nr:hypothetical protein LR48_Vigan10g178900 [Vigna angularis]